MELNEITNLGWARDPNSDGEEIPNLFKDHGYSKGFIIDNQSTESKTAFVLYYFPDKFAVIDRIIDCGHGDDDKLFRGYIKTKKDLKKIMIEFKIKRG